MTVLDLLDAPESLEPPPPVLELRGAARQFPGDPPVHALHPADLAVGSGDYLSVVGPSGSGKSTLLDLLGLLDKPTDGEYLLDGIPTVGAGERERAALRAGHIGFVFQAFHLMPHLTVLGNVLPPRCTAASRARAARPRAGGAGPRRAGPSHRLRPHRAVGRRAPAGGDRARDRHQPAVILADEPTGTSTRRAPRACWPCSTSCTPPG